MIFDIILFIILIYSVYVGYKKGLIVMLLSFLGKIFAAVVAYKFYPNVTLLLNQLFSLDKVLENEILLRLRTMGGQGVVGSVSATDIDAMNKLPIPQNISDSLKTYLTDKTGEIGRSVAASVSSFFVSIISVVLLFFAVLIIVMFVSKFLKMASKITIIKEINIAGGVLFSVIKNYIIVSFIVLILMSIASIHKHPFLEENVKNSFLTKHMIENNFIIEIISKTKF